MHRSGMGKTCTSPSVSSQNGGAMSTTSLTRSGSGRTSTKFIRLKLRDKASLLLLRGNQVRDVIKHSGDWIVAWDQSLTPDSTKLFPTHLALIEVVGTSLKSYGFRVLVTSNIRMRRLSRCCGTTKISRTILEEYGLRLNNMPQRMLYVWADKEGELCLGVRCPHKQRPCSACSPMLLSRENAVVNFGSLNEF